MYACRAFDSLGACSEWVELNNFIVELSSLSTLQVGELLSMTALLFGSAWLWKHLSLFAKRG